MIIALLIPLFEAWQSTSIWQKILAFSSITTKTAIVLLTISVFRDDWMIGVVSVIILSVGNTGIILLAELINRLKSDDIWNKH
jgi:multicomponent Na+:H+ antiporter subunit F